MNSGNEVTVAAWTVGNPDVYDPNLAEVAVTKVAGGAVFLEIDVARAAVADGHLPKAWGLDHLPGAVYELSLPSVDAVEGPRDEVGAFRLSVDVPIVRKVPS